MTKQAQAQANAAIDQKFKDDALIKGMHRQIVRNVVKQLFQERGWSLVEFCREMRRRVDKVESFWTLAGLATLQVIRYS